MLRVFDSRYKMHAQYVGVIRRDVRSDISQRSRQRTERTVRSTESERAERGEPLSSLDFYYKPLAVHILVTHLKSSSTPELPVEGSVQPRGVAVDGTSTRVAPRARRQALSRVYTTVRYWVYVCANGSGRRFPLHNILLRNKVRGSNPKSL